MNCKYYLQQLSPSVALFVLCIRVVFASADVGVDLNVDIDVDVVDIDDGGDDNDVGDDGGGDDDYDYDYYYYYDVDFEDDAANVGIRLGVFYRQPIDFLLDLPLLHHPSRSMTLSSS